MLCRRASGHGRGHSGGAGSRFWMEPEAWIPHFQRAGHRLGKRKQQGTLFAGPPDNRGVDKVKPRHPQAIPSRQSSVSGSSSHLHALPSRGRPRPTAQDGSLRPYSSQWEVGEARRACPFLLRTGSRFYTLTSTHISLARASHTPTPSCQGLRNVDSGWPCASSTSTVLWL